MPPRAYNRSSSSEDEDEILTPEKYSCLQLSTALANPLHRLRAAQELTACFNHLYSRYADKGAQTLMFQDAILAAQQSDRSSAWAQALAALVHDANKQLPRQKGAQLAAQRKQTLMRLQRMRKRDAKQAGHSTKHDEDSDEEQPMFELPLPHEVTLKALSLLDPVSLARCQCVCRAWQSLAKEPSLWGILIQQVWPKQRPAGGGTHPHAQFARLAQEHPRSILVYKSTRNFADGNPSWQQSGGTVRAGVKGMTVQHVIDWLQGRRLKWARNGRSGAGANSSSSSDSSSDSDRGTSLNQSSWPSGVPPMRLWAITVPKEA